MPKRKLTAAAVQRLKPPATGQVDYFDVTYPGLCLRVSSKGVRSWSYFGRLGGKLKRVTLGRFPTLTLAQARVKAGEAAEDLRAGIDPTQAKREARQNQGKNTFETIADEWLKRDQAGNRGQREVRRVLDHDVLPRWRHRNIQTITRRDVIELIDSIADRGAVVMARRTHAYLHRCFRWCVARGILEFNPMADLPKPGKEVKRDRVLSDSELRDIWRTLDATDWPFGPAIKLLLLTGARRDEIGSLRWSEIDFEGAVIRLESARTKTAEPHVIPLSPPAVQILAGLPHIAGNDGRVSFVFTTTGDTAVSGWSRAKHLLDRHVANARNSEPLDEWRFHDLRRTVATGLQRLGSRLEVIEAVLGHVSGSKAGVVGIYQRHAYTNEKRIALEVWAGHVLEVIGEKQADNVLKMHQNDKAIDQS